MGVSHGRGAVSLLHTFVSVCAKGGIKNGIYSVLSKFYQRKTDALLRRALKTLDLHNRGALLVQAEELNQIAIEARLESSSAHR